MTLDCKVEVIQSLKVHLVFDDESVKDSVVAVDDLIDIVWNGNGARKHMIGRVAAISAHGCDPKSWYMIVDGADDFASRREKIAPMSILDLTVIRKASDEDLVRTVKGDNACPYLRVVSGHLQYSNDGLSWRFIKINDDDIEPQEGTVVDHSNTNPPSNGGCGHCTGDGIEEAEY